MSSAAPITVITIDDHPLFRKGVADLIEMGDNLKLIGEATNGHDGVELAKQLSPDIILLDINMRDIDGIETLRRLREAGVESRVIMLTVSDNEHCVVSALRAGADGYLLKDMEPDDLLDALNATVKGEFVISDTLKRYIGKALKNEVDVVDTIDGAGLTEREREILAHLARGESNKVIAANLDIAEGTVKVHVKNLLKKLKLRSRVEAAVWAINQENLF